MYKVTLSEQAQSDYAYFVKGGNVNAVKKIVRLLKELEEHPFTGTGKPEQLKGCGGSLWSRHITKKHRLIYEIIEAVVHVDVLSAYGHYDDK